MKPRKTWLHTAVRAFQTQTLDHQHHVARARDTLDAATQQQQAAQDALKQLVGDWSEQREQRQLDPTLDAAYQRFHRHLQQQELGLATAQQRAQAGLEVATERLKSSHGTQRVLERLAEQVAQRHAREVRVREHEATAEAWLLAQVSTREGS